jgi:hypothetical protein
MLAYQGSDLGGDVERWLREAMMPGMDSVLVPLPDALRPSM